MQKALTSSFIIKSKLLTNGKIFQELSDKLNELEEEGWEVVSMEDTNMWEGASRV